MVQSLRCTINRNLKVFVSDNKLPTDPSFSQILDGKVTQINNGVLPEPSRELNSTAI